MTPTEQTLSRFVMEEILRDASLDTIAADQLLIENGILDSLGLLRLVGFLEKEFDVEIEDDDLMPENFQTISAIAKLVESVRD